MNRSSSSDAEALGPRARENVAVVGLARRSPATCHQLVLSARRLSSAATRSSPLDALLNGGSGVLLISGEAGIGKSRLAREAVALAAVRGYRVLQGACFDRDQSLPTRRCLT